MCSPSRLDGQSEELAGLWQLRAQLSVLNGSWEVPCKFLRTRHSGECCGHVAHLARRGPVRQRGLGQGGW